MLKMCVIGKKSHHEIKTILANTVILLKINLSREYQKAELVGGRGLRHFRGCPSKSLCEIRSFLGLMSNIINVSFETKIASEMFLEMKIHQKYASLQQNITTRDE